MSTKIPIFLLKTKSIPIDTYEEYFSTFTTSAKHSQQQYSPIFVPVLEHQFKHVAVDQVRQYIIDGSFTSSLSEPSKTTTKFGAIIFTSQRAVEAFTSIISSLRSTDSSQAQTVPINQLLPPTIPFYVVGPATARGLASLSLPNPILGAETGNGEALATFILSHYNTLHPDDATTTQTKPPILFLVGEKRRDVIPKTLQSPHLPPTSRITISELEIYETVEMASFRSNFTSLLNQSSPPTHHPTQRFVIIFSPASCRAMLESLGVVLDSETGKVLAAPNRLRPAKTKIITIGPTTRDYLKDEFDFVPDGCAETPSPEGIGRAIEQCASLDI